MPRWKKKSSELIAKSTLFTMLEDEVILPDGTEKKYTIVDFPDFAGVLPIYEDQFVFVQNYRYPIDEFVLEIPAGLIDQGETPLETAKRELEEETGYVLKNARDLCTYHPIASLNTQKAYLFLGEVVEGGKKAPDKGEDMKTCLLDIEETYERLYDGEIIHPHTMIALFFAKRKVEALKRL